MKVGILIVSPFGERRIEVEAPTAQFLPDKTIAAKLIAGELVRALIEKPQSGPDDGGHGYF